MNSVDYTQKFNRQNELYQQKLREQRDSHEESLSQVQKTSENRMKGQSEAYSKDRLNAEKNHAATISNLRNTQGKELQEKSKQYEQTVEKNKNEFHDLRQKNLGEWSKKFGDLQKSYSDSLERNEISNKQAKDEITKNYQENLGNVRNKSEEDLKTYISNNASKGDNSKEAHRKQLMDLEEKSREERSAILADKLRDDNIFKKSITNEVSDMRKKQEIDFNNGRDFNKNRFDQLQHDQNQKRQSFEADRIDKMETAHQKANRTNNDLFAEKYTGLKRNYEQDLRKMENRARAEKVSRGEIGKQILAEQRANERQQFENQKGTLIAGTRDLTNSYEQKLVDQGDSYQDTYKKIRIENADTIAKHTLKVTEDNRQKDLKIKMREENVANNHRIALDYSEDRSKARLDSQATSSKTQLNNLKEDFNKGMELATFKARKDFEKNREETVKEKAELQKRLHESNAKTNTLLKKVYADKMEKMETGLEKRIMELENQNKLILTNSHEQVMDVKNQAKIEIDRQREIAQRSAKDQVNEERKVAESREKELRKSINKLQASFSQRINEQSSLSSQRLKRTIREMDLQRKEEVRKYQDIIDQNDKLYQREMARIVASSDAEKDALISQYEDRIKQMQKLNQDKIQEMKEFDRVNNNA